MAKPLSAPDSHRNGTNGAYNIRAALAEVTAADAHAAPTNKPRPIDAETIENLRAENVELRTLCNELEQALQESSQQNDQGDAASRMSEYDALLEEKNEVIRSLHQDLQSAHSALAEAEAAANAAPVKRVPTGPLPREEELLTLSEELERERRQLQEDEQTLMDQMREMEVSMARERAEMARQRNDLQRLQNEVRHELERLEKSGAMQTKIDQLRGKLQDVSTRRGAAPTPQPHSKAEQPQPQEAAPTTAPTKKKDTLMGRLFG
jgi:DNA repair exonuclease SbcCD ATPase subunit